MTWVDITVPPSANALYVQLASGERVKTRAYRNWLNSQSLRLRMRACPPEERNISVEIEANIDRRRDLDNLVKPILDALQHEGIIRDDRYVDHIHIERTEQVAKQWARVRITAR